MCLLVQISLHVVLASPRTLTCSPEKSRNVLQEAAEKLAARSQRHSQRLADLQAAVAGSGSNYSDSSSPMKALQAIIRR